MPRPTRSRVAATRHGGNSSSSSDPAFQPTVPAQPEPAHDPYEDDIYGVSDRELERVRKEKEAAAKAKKETPRKRAATRSSLVAGNSPKSSSAAAVLRASRERRDAALKRLDDLTSTTTDNTEVEAGRNEAGRAMLGEGSSLLAPSVGAGAVGGLSGLEIHDDEIFGNLDNSSGFLDGDSSNGLRSADTTTASFNVSVFKRQQQPRRRRQSSIVGKDDAPIRPSSRGPTTPGLSSTFSVGNFRRRRREPSILLSSAQKASVVGTVQRARATSVEGRGDNAVESGPEEEEDSFLPEAEGTPVRPSRGRPSETRSRKRKSDGAEDDNDTTAHKRQAVVDDIDEAAVHQSIEIDSSPPPARRRAATPEIDDAAILAPPLSSSSSSSSREASPALAWPSLKDLGKKSSRRRNVRNPSTPTLDHEHDRDHDMSDISEPPSLTHSPNFGPTKRGRKNASPAAGTPKLSTADLEALLPRRRHRVHDDEEEEPHSDPYAADARERSPRRRVEQRPTNKSRAVQQKGKGKQIAEELPGHRHGRSGNAARRTYGSRGVDREAGGEGAVPLDDTAFEADEGGSPEAAADLGEELKKASRKFKEVDGWELDFEEVVESSSPLPGGR